MVTCTLQPSEPSALMCVRFWVPVRLPTQSEPSTGSTEVREGWPPYVGYCGDMAPVRVLNRTAWPLLGP